MPALSRGCSLPAGLVRSRPSLTDRDDASSSASSSCSLPQLVAQRRANAWQAERKRRLLARAEEITGRSSAATSFRKTSSSCSSSRTWCRCVRTCGHQCYYLQSRQASGQFSGTMEHGPCLTCLGQHRETCVICMEGLTEHPVVRVDCGHFFHAHCITQRVEVGAKHNSAGEPILFDFLECPLCKHPGINRLASVCKFPPLRRQLELRSMVSSQKEMLGGGRFVFQVCQRCTLPYCSGADECHAAVARERKVRLEAVCAPCSQDLPAGNPRVCPKHGTEAIAWKCRYCCSVATFECFSGRQQLHACESCHQLAELGHLFDFETMENADALESYGACPVRRAVYPFPHKDEGKPLGVKQIRAVEHRLASVTEKLEQCERELDEVASKGELADAAALHRLRRKQHSFLVEKEDVARLVKGWSAGDALVCPLKGLHPPTGVEYCLGCTLCNPDITGCPS